MITDTTRAVRSAATLLLTALLIVAGCSSIPRETEAGLDGATAVGSSGASADSTLSFDAPEVAHGGPKKVFAHYFPPYPVSFDNREPSSDYYATEYLNPQGEGGKFTDVGGFFRDRPIPREPRTEADWVDADLRDEVRQALSAGIDGFTVDILAPVETGNFTFASRPAALLSAAAAVDPDFSVMLMPDMSGALAELSPVELADEMATLAVYPSVYRLDDGRLVVSPFLGEAKTAQWWREFSDAMLTRHGRTVALVPVFVNSNVDLASYADVSYGMSAWGARNPAFNPVVDTGPQSPLGQAAIAHELGKIWMAPVSVQDVRPSQSIYDEAMGTSTLRTMWQNAIDSDSEWVQLVTWNDYSEATSFAPSVRHGWSFLDISEYWVWWFKRGEPLPIVRDAVYLTHRTQLVSAASSLPVASPMVLRTGSTPAMDEVEALVFSTSAADVTVTTSAGDTTCSVPAGVGICRAAAAPGSVSAVLTRDGERATGIDSPFVIENSPTVPSLDYVSVSSRR